MPKIHARSRSGMDWTKNGCRNERLAWYTRYDLPYTLIKRFFKASGEAFNTAKTNEEIKATGMHTSSV
ncbi:hypothetical protein NXT3_PB00499 (plasmid) [Sinorhizobium fredii]|uniref:Uncharacterized protein n=1 Tax=Rhizobium fredii TaxID=380 RepID=A0A2L0HCC5_RHIFR|nr:hypothetical protein NXT3_PB00499 [Sinorhizobium fredii]